MPPRVHTAAAPTESAASFARRLLYDKLGGRCEARSRPRPRPDRAPTAPLAPR